MKSLYGGKGHSAAPACPCGSGASEFTNLIWENLHGKNFCAFLEQDL